MNWINLLWPMVTGVCLTLGLIHLRLGLAGAPRAAHLLFALNAFAVAAVSWVELALMHAASPAAYHSLLFLGDLATWTILASLSGFIWIYFGSGTRWLALAGPVLNAIALFSYPVLGLSPAYLQITGLRTVETWGGATFLAPVAMPNPWNAVNFTAVLLVVVFVVDASVRLWKRGARQRAAIVGGSVTFFLLAAGLHSALIEAGVITSPYLISWFYLALLIAMGHELTVGFFAAVRLSRKLRESEQRMTLAVEAANFGIWIRDLTKNEIWASEKWRELFGFTPAEPLEFEHVLARMHPDDRVAVRRAYEKSTVDGSAYEMDYRLLLPDGSMRWIASRGRGEYDRQGRLILMRGAARDITARKQAEEAAHQLSGRLIQAQERAQVQLARELHDDLSQSLALLSVELEMFGQNPPVDASRITARMEAFSTQVKGLSSEVHQLSHELHPAKLDQLGLVAALRGFCKEFALAHALAIEFSERDVPRTTPSDAALCLYRIAQEALHNVVKHSSGTGAKVELLRENGHLQLVVTDDGAGFDPETTRGNGSLGLISMSERARFVGGRLHIDSRPGAGTRVEVRVPIAKDASPLR